MNCYGCGKPARSGWCSNACYRVNGKSGNAECAICQIDRETGRRGNQNAIGICAACKDEPANKGWGEGSDLEQGSADLEQVMAIEGSQAMLEGLFGGRRKGNTDMTRQILDLVLTGTVVRRRRRRNANGNKRRGWEERPDPMTVSEIAKAVGCSRRWVHYVLGRQES